MSWEYESTIHDSNVLSALHLRQDLPVNEEHLVFTFELATFARLRAESAEFEYFESLAPGVGFEPTTNALTAHCSTAELPRNMDSRKSIEKNTTLVNPSLF